MTDFDFLFRKYHKRLLLYTLKFVESESDALDTCQTKKLPVIETGSITPMPDEWIDKDTRNKVVKLTARMEGNSLSFYFHNNPYIGDEMVFYNSNTNGLAKVVRLSGLTCNNQEV